MLDSCLLQMCILLHAVLLVYCVFLVRLKTKDDIKKSGTITNTSSKNIPICFKNVATLT